tara:strand:+ start:401 stop:568 length:168 start_codon:yes stop_codon:yes gene_type:complete
MIQAGDLVKYKTPSEEFRVGVVLKILSKFERDDNILVLWNDERSWCVKEDWIIHV